MGFYYAQGIKWGLENSNTLWNNNNTLVLWGALIVYASLHSLGSTYIQLLVSV